jgi:hypothetical protein
MPTPTPWDAVFHEGSTGAEYSFVVFDAERRVVWCGTFDGVLYKYDSQTGDQLATASHALVNDLTINLGNGSPYLVAYDAGFTGYFVHRLDADTLAIADSSPDFGLYSTSAYVSGFASGVYLNFLSDPALDSVLRKYSLDLQTVVWSVTLTELQANCTGSLVEDGDGHLWLIGRGASAVYLFDIDPADGGYTAYDVTADLTLLNNYDPLTQHLAYDPANDQLIIWYLASPNKLARFSLATHAVVQVLADARDAYHGRFYSFPAAHDGRLWVNLKNADEANHYSLLGELQLSDLTFTRTYSLLPDETWAVAAVPPDGLWCALSVDYCQPSLWVEERLPGASHTNTGVWRLALPDDSPDPSCTTPQVCDPVPLKDIMAELYQKAGLSPSDYDVSAQTQLVTGYLVPRRMAAREALLPLLHAYFVDVVERDDQLVGVNRGGASALTIPPDDLGAYEAGQEPGPLVERTRTPDFELPRRLEVQYLEPARDLQTGQQHAQRTIAPEPTMYSGEPLAINLSLVLDADEAKQIAEKTLYTAWVERTQLAFALGPKYSRLEPADVITVMADGVSYRVRLVQVDRGTPGLLRCIAVVEDQTTYSSEHSGALTDVPLKELYPPATGIIAFLDTAIARDDDDDPGFYLGVYSLEEGWRFGVVFRSTDDVSYDGIASLGSMVSLGVAGDAIPDGPHDTWDRAHTLRVTMLHGDLFSASEVDVLNWQANLALYGDELIQWQSAVEVSPNVYDLSLLLRGRKGTEWACGTHAAGERFVLPSAGTVVRYAAPLSDFLATRYYKVVSPGQLVVAVGAVTFVNQARGLRCYAPVGIAATRDGSDNLTLSWTRRTRYQAEWLDYSDVPLGEAAEAYEVDVLDAPGGTVLRTISGLTSPTASYSAADQTADGLTPGDPVTVVVYQLNSVIGRGYGAEATV